MLFFYCQLFVTLVIFTNLTCQHHSVESIVCNPVYQKFSFCRQIYQRSCPCPENPSVSCSSWLKNEYAMFTLTSICIGLGSLAYNIYLRIILKNFFLFFCCLVEWLFFKFDIFSSK